MQVIFNGNLLPNGAVISEVVTICEKVNGTDNDYRVIVMPAKQLTFEPKWKGFTLRGYGKTADVPVGNEIDLSSAPIYKGMRIPENGAVYFI